MQRNMGEKLSIINFKGSHEMHSFLYGIFFCKQAFEKEEVPIFLTEVVCKKLISSAHQPGKKLYTAFTENFLGSKADARLIWLGTT